MAIWNRIHWMCVIILTTTKYYSGYKHDTRFNPYASEMSKQQNQYYSEATAYVKLERNNNTKMMSSNRIKTRSENSSLKIINMLPFSYQNQRDSKDEASSNMHDAIVFPSELMAETVMRPHAGNFLPQVSDECKQGDTLCLSVPNYPEEYIDSLISNSAEEWHQTMDQLVEEVQINQRIGEDPNEFELCNYREAVVFPKAAENKDNKWLSIINTPLHIQGFRIEICRNEGSSCHAAASFRFGMTASCKQKHVLREMRALDSNGQLITDFFKLPSCCTCVVRYDDGKI